MRKNVDVVRAFAAVLSAALFSMIFAILASSCTENNASEATPVKKTAKLQLVVTGTSSTPQGRSTGTLPATEDKINTLAIGVFNADGSVNGVSEFEPQTIEEASEMYCTPGNCDIVVVANAPKGTFVNVQTKDEFLSKTVDLSQTATNNKQEPDNLPMSGQQGTVTLAPNATTPVTIKLTRLVARISVASIKTAFAAGSDNANATFKLDKVYLCNVLSKSRIAPGDVSTTFPTSPQWLNEDKVTLGTGAWTGQRFLMNEITPVVLSGMGAGEYNVPNWFYAFANNDENHRTKLVISGWYDADGDGTTAAPAYVYYPIVVNQAQLGTDFSGDTADAHNGTISRNRDYRLRATIAKKGVNSPEEEIGVAELQLTVSVDNWKLEIIQDVTIE